MAVDTKIPLGKPGVAEFKSETFGNYGDLRNGEAPITMTNITVTATGADIDLPLYSVVDKTGGALANQAGVTAPDRANYVLAEPIFIANGSSMTVPVIRSGPLNMDVLNWDASYDTDAKKAAAFEGSVSPTIFVSKPAYNSDQIL